MYGTEYSHNPEILLESFGEMNKSYKKIKRSQSKFLIFFEGLYIKLFGIPEIGFQIRGMYFENALGKIKPNGIKSILDAGSGIGFYSLKLARAFPKAKVTAGEINQDKLSFAKEFSRKNNVDNIQYVYFDITKPQKKQNTYNLIVNIDVLEHIEDYKKVLKNFNRMLVRNGYIYIHTPQPHQKRLFKPLKKWHHEDHVHEGYSPEDLVQEFKNIGFKIISVRETFGFFGKAAWELNHLSFKKGFVVSGLAYPLLFLLSTLDLLLRNKNGLGTAILAQKK